MSRTCSKTLLVGWVLGLLCVGGPAHGAEAPLRLEEVLDSVDATHPDVEKGQRGVDKAEAKALAARGGFDPKFSIKSKWSPVGYYDNTQIDATLEQPTTLWGASLYAGYRVGWGEYPSYKGDLQTRSAGEIRAGIDVPLWRDGPIDARRAKIEQTKIGRKGARASLSATSLAVQRKAAKAYWKWVAAGQKLDVADALLDLAKRRDVALASQVAAGAVEPIKQVDNRRLVLERTAKVVAAQRAFDAATIDLSLYLRDGEQVPVRVSEDRVLEKFPDPVATDGLDMDQQIAQALRRRPEVEVVEAEKEVASVGVRLAKNRRAPQANLQSFVAKDIGDGPVELAPVEWGLGLVISIPLPLRKARGEYREAKAELAAVKATARGLADKIAAEVRLAEVSLRAARRSWALAKEQVEVATTLAGAERTRFREGASDLIVVNLRELAEADAENAAISAAAEYHQAYAVFMTATGRSPLETL